MTLFDNMKKILGIFTTLFVFYISLLLFTALFVFSIRGYTAFKQSSSVTIEPDSITLDGNQMVSRSDILLLASLDAPVSYMDISAYKIEHSLSVHPWIKTVVVLLTPPDSLYIVLEEHHAEALVNQKDDNGVNTFWFTDKMGFMFKKVFPGEKGFKELPFILLNTLLQKEQKESVIRTALALTYRWGGEGSFCRITTVHYSLVNGFSADCLFGKEMTTVLEFGDLTENEVNKDSDVMYNMFNNLAHSYYTKHKWIGEYVFEEKDGRYRVIVGNIEEVPTNVKE